MPLLNPVAQKVVQQIARNLNLEKKSPLSVVQFQPTKSKLGDVVVSGRTVMPVTSLPAAAVSQKIYENIQFAESTEQEIKQLPSNATVSIDGKAVQRDEALSIVNKNKHAQIIAYRDVSRLPSDTIIKVTQSGVVAVPPSAATAPDAPFKGEVNVITSKRGSELVADVIFGYAAKPFTKIASFFTGKKEKYATVPKPLKQLSREFVAAQYIGASNLLAFGSAVIKVPNIAYKVAKGKFSFENVGKNIQSSFKDAPKKNAFGIIGTGLPGVNPITSAIIAPISGTVKSVHFKMDDKDLYKLPAVFQRHYISAWDVAFEPVKMSPPGSSAAFRQMVKHYPVATIGSTVLAEAGSAVFISGAWKVAKSTGKSAVISVRSTRAASRAFPKPVGAYEKYMYGLTKSEHAAEMRGITKATILKPETAGSLKFQKSIGLTGDFGQYSEEVLDIASNTKWSLFKRRVPIHKSLLTDTEGFARTVFFKRSPSKYLLEVEEVGKKSFYRTTETDIAQLVPEFIPEESSLRFSKIFSGVKGKVFPRAEDYTTVFISRKKAITVKAYPLGGYAYPLLTKQLPSSTASRIASFLAIKPISTGYAFAAGASGLGKVSTIKSISKTPLGLTDIILPSSSTVVFPSSAIATFDEDAWIGKNNNNKYVPAEGIQIIKEMPFAKSRITIDSLVVSPKTKDILGNVKMNGGYSLFHRIFANSSSALVDRSAKKASMPAIHDIIISHGEKFIDDGIARRNTGMPRVVGVRERAKSSVRIPRVSDIVFSSKTTPDEAVFPLLASVKLSKVSPVKIITPEHVVHTRQREDITTILDTDAAQSYRFFAPLQETFAKEITIGRHKPVFYEEEKHKKKDSTRMLADVSKKYRERSFYIPDIGKHQKGGGAFF